MLAAADDTAPERRRVFLDHDLDDAIRERGFAVVPGLLPAEDVAHLAAVLHDCLGEGHDGLVFSNEVRDPADRSRAERTIGAVVGPHLLGLLDRYRLAASLFVLKLPGDAGRRIWHADPALVDERHFTSVSAWVPLVDVDEVNGAFTVVEDSHRIVPVVRGGVRVQGHLFPSEPEVEALCDGPRTLIPLRAGDALLYDHRLAHGSPANRSDAPRWAVNVPAVPEEAPLVHYIREADGSVDVYRLPDDYFYDHDAGIPVVEDPRAERVARVDLATGGWREPV